MDAKGHLKRIKEKKGRFQLQVEIAENLYNKISKLHKTSDWERLLSNNSRIFKEDFIIDALRDALSGGYITDFEKFSVIYGFKLSGDPIAKGVYGLHEKHAYERSVNNPVIHGSGELVRKLLTRSMTEEEYTGCLEGRLPVSIYVEEDDGKETHRKEYYLNRGEEERPEDFFRELKKSLLGYPSRFG